MGMSLGIAALSLEGGPYPPAGGDPGVPEWVPIGAFGYVDFRDLSHVWIDGEISEVSDMLATAVDAGYIFDETRMIPGEGYYSGGDYIGGMYIGAVLSHILAGCTVVYTFNVTSMASTQSMSSDFYDYPDYTTDWYFTVNNGIDAAGPSKLSDSAGIDLNPGDLVSGINKVALTYSTDELAISRNGGTTVSGANPATPVAPTQVEFGSNKTGFRFLEIAIYAPATHGELETLSTL